MVEQGLSFPISIAESEIWMLQFDGSQKNLLVVAADVMAGDGVRHLTIDPRFDNQDTIIYAPRALWPLLDKLRKDKEFNALQSAVYGRGENDLQIVLSQLNKLDQKRFHQLHSLFWNSYSQNLAKLGETSRRNGNFLKSEIYQSQSLGAQQMSQDVLYGDKSLSDTGIRNWVSNIILDLKLNSKIKQ